MCRRGCALRRVNSSQRPHSTPTWSPCSMNSEPLLPMADLRHAQVDDIASERVAQMFREAPRPWSATSNNDGNHELVDANGAPIAQSPMFGWLRAIAEVVNGGASAGGREAP